ncbi:uncharacterized protein N7459_007821 [Penicillium hispanicum]|uniref:uncharacterized protein n=1 Tax=Penicillium hispanicum TaxID=1080232 RepID=UPI0025419EA1|nr:uncharacterized protein N7459_007821 [Penicillium hispanicum]KAJ5573394.1 hypothetical protein N7459_007821 [Penicillium hispanicum]
MGYSRLSPTAASILPSADNAAHEVVVLKDFTSLSHSPTLRAPASKSSATSESTEYVINLRFCQGRTAILRDGVKKSIA